ELYLAVLCRPPSKKELKAGLAALKDGEEDYPTWLAQARKHRDALAAYEKTLPEKQRAWEAGLTPLPVWKTLEAVSAAAEGGARLGKQADGSLLATDKLATPETYPVTAKTNLTGITAIRLEALPDKSLRGGGPGRAANGNFVLNEFRVQAREQGSSAK